MRLSEKRAIVLFEIAKWSIGIAGGAAGYPSETIERVVKQIINQQSDTLVELDK